jgi:sugar-specific transcriptional regulator TrmB
MLVEFGLSSLQARTYLGLVRLGRCKASQASSSLGIVRPEVYRVLRELSLKGLVERSPGSPSIYTPTPPDQAANILIGGLTKKLTDLKQKQQFLIRSLTAEASDNVNAEVERFNLISGGNIFKKHIDMLLGAKDDYVSISSKEGLNRMGGEGILGDDFTRAIVNASRRGIRIRIISEIDKANKKSADYLSRYAELRKLRDLLFYIDIIDKREMIIGPDMTDEEITQRNREADLWTNNPKFIRGMYLLFEKLWRSSRPYQKL